MPRGARPGDRLQFESYVEKSGRVIGFQRCDVRDARSGRLVARSTHTKHIDMGRMWPLLFGPLLLDIWMPCNLRFSPHF